MSAFTSIERVSSPAIPLLQSSRVPLRCHLHTRTRTYTLSLSSLVQFLKRIGEIVDPATIGANIASMSSKPHAAGTQNSRNNAAFLLEQLQSYGLNSFIESYQILLTYPVRRSVKLISPEEYTCTLTEGSVRGARASRSLVCVAVLDQVHRVSTSRLGRQTAFFLSPFIPLSLFSSLSRSDCGRRNVQHVGGRTGLAAVEWLERQRKRNWSSGLRQLLSPGGFRRAEWHGFDRYHCYVPLWSGECQPRGGRGISTQLKSPR